RDTRYADQAKRERLCEEHERQHSFTDLIESHVFGTRFHVQPPLYGARGRVGQERRGREASTDTERQIKKRTDKGTSKNPGYQTTPGLVTAEQPLAIRHHIAEVDGDRPAVTGQLGRDDR